MGHRWTRASARPIYDVQDEKAWNRVFGGPIPVTVGYVLKETIEKSPDLVQGYVNASWRAQQWIHRAKDEEVVELLVQAVHGLVLSARSSCAR